jgi:hypothetical protein
VPCTDQRVAEFMANTATNEKRTHADLGSNTRGGPAATQGAPAATQGGQQHNGVSRLAFGRIVLKHRSMRMGRADNEDLCTSGRVAVSVKRW